MIPKHHSKSEINEFRGLEVGDKIIFDNRKWIIKHRAVIGHTISLTAEANLSSDYGFITFITGLGGIRVIYSTVDNICISEYQLDEKSKINKLISGARVVIDGQTEYSLKFNPLTHELGRKDIRTTSILAPLVVGHVFSNVGEWKVTTITPNGSVVLALVTDPANEIFVSANDSRNRFGIVFEKGNAK